MKGKLEFLLQVDRYEMFCEVSTATNFRLQCSFSPLPLLSVMRVVMVHVVKVSVVTVRVVMMVVVMARVVMVGWS